MGQKVNPNGFRIGIYKDWNAHWFARTSYADFVLEDINIRKNIKSMLGTNAAIARIVIDRAGSDQIRIEIHTSSPGVIIGKKGQDIENLRKKVAKLTRAKEVEVSVQEIHNPELSAMLIAENIALQLERRGNFKQILKKVATVTMRSNAVGIKIICSGRLNGAEIARSEAIRLGSVPLHTLRSDIDYGLAEAKTTYGIIGVKVWICRGDFH